MDTLPRKPVVMIVDDVEANQALLEAILRYRGYDTISFARGERAIAAASQNPPDLILMDIMMPDMDGFEVCQRLKADAALREIPVIFISALEDVDNKVKAFVNGGVDYISKPFQAAEVLARVSTHLKLCQIQRELKKQNEILAESIQLREVVESIARHDLKSPLNLLVNAPAMLLRDKNLSPEQLELLKIMKKSGMRMLEMINRSLDMVKMERNQYSINPVSVNVLNVAHQVIVELDSLIRAKSIDVQILVDGNEASDEASFALPGEEYLFFSLLSNLIKNALESSPAGEKIVLTFDSARHRIEITNCGVIPAEIRSRLLVEKYVTHGKTGGTGLGAYSARLMARTLFGRLDFKSSEDGKTSFWIDFSQDNQTLSAGRDENHACSGQSSSRQTDNILVVVSYANTRSLITKILREMGSSAIFEADSVAAARKMLASERMSLIISDWDLSVENGKVILDEVRSKPDGAAIPFIFFAGEITEDVVFTAGQDGKTSLLSRPFSPDVLKGKVTELLLSKKNQKEMGKY
ncbi:MAG: two-component hybrid sensor and regulator [uncultured bacterium]|nr:MAG: two-component hybrid sensor and regulator [uncultured bacterium]